MVAIACLVGLGLTSDLGAQDRLSQAALRSTLPNDAHAVLATNSFLQLHRHWERSTFGQQLQSPAWQPLIQSHQRASEGTWFNPKPWFGLQWSDLQAVDRPGAIAISPNPESDKKNQYVYVLFFALGEDAQAHGLVQKWTEYQGGLVRLQKTSFGSTALYTAKAATGANQVAMAVGPRWTCFSSSDRWLKNWLATASNDSPSLVEEWRALDKSTDTESPAMMVWAQPWKLIKGFTEQADPKVFRSLKLFGCEDLLRFHSQLIAPTPSSPHWKMNYELHVAEPLSKGLGMLSYTTGPNVTMPPVFPSDLDQVGQSYIDIKPWFQGVSHAIDQAIDEESSGNFADLLDSILSDPEGPKVDIRQDLIYRLGPMVCSGSKTILDGEASEENKNALGAKDAAKALRYRRQRLWCCQLQDAKLAESALNKLFSGDEEVTSERIGRFQCWSTSDNQSLFVATSNPEGQSICVAAVDDKYLYLANDSEWLKRLVASATESKETKPIPNAMVFDENSGDVSARHLLHLRSWLRRSWARIPESSDRGAVSADLVALALTRILFANIKATEVPSYAAVEPMLGVLNHRMLRSGGKFSGGIQLEVAKTVK
jgi:hypothetical protein